MKTQNLETPILNITIYTEVRTVGDLKAIVKNLADDVMFGFFNQPEQNIELRAYKSNKLQSLVLNERQQVPNMCSHPFHMVISCGKKHHCVFCGKDIK